MRSILIVVLWFFTGPLFAQQRYAFSYLRSAELSPGLMDKIHEYQQVRAYGLLENRAVWIIFNDDIPRIETWFKENQIHTEIVALNVQYGNTCSLAIKDDHLSLNFVHYSSYITKFNIQDSPKLFRSHDEYIKRLKQTGNVMLEGFFDNSDGGIMIMKGELQKEAITADPAIENGIIEAEISRTSLFRGAGCQR